jgi:hypothetical protein
MRSLFNHFRNVQKTLQHKHASPLYIFFLIVVLTVTLSLNGRSLFNMAVEAATYTAGVTTIGSILDSGNNNGISSTQVTTGANAGTLSTIKVYIGTVNAQPNNHMRVAIYADNGSDAPGALLASSAAQVLTKNSWNSFAMSAITINANTKYWLGFNVDGANTKYALALNASAKSAWKIPTTYGTWPNPFGTPSEPIAAKQYSIYMTYDSVAPTATPTPTTAPTATPTPTTAPTPTPTSTPGCTGVTVATTDDLQSKINANPAGTTFCLAAGTHKPTSQSGYTPLSNDIFVGNGDSAVISGSKDVIGFTASGSNFVATGFLPGSPSTQGQCRSDHPLCKQAQDVYYDGVRLDNVSSQGNLGVGKVFLDYPSNKLYIHDNPSGHTIEQAWATKLFSGSATGVQIKNLTIQMTAGPAQTGVIDPASGATGWVVDHNNLRFNHGYGVGPGISGGLTITANHIHHNGQIGTGGDGGNITVNANEVDHNNTAGYDDLWEAGNKFGHATNFTITNNYYHDDFGPGIWCDINCANGTISGNYVAHEWGQGIFYEISCGPVSIHDNTLVGNYIAGIMASASKNVDIYNNAIYTDPTYTHPLAGAIIGDQRGIWNFQQDRPETSSCGEHVATNVTTHDNSVESNGPDSSFGGKNGLWTDTQRTDIYNSLGNSFTHNTYHDTAAGSEWAWNVCGTYTCVLSFASWQSAGQDTTGSVVADDPTAPAPPSLVTGPQP